MSKFKILINAIYGECIKTYYKIIGFSRIRSIPGISNPSQRRERIILSLTSYGRRVSNVLPFTLVSLLRQTLLPDAIIVWLDKDEWNDDTLPVRLKKLKEKGITIKYCDNYRSYKKLTPSLKEYPEDIIVTFDDDLFYDKMLLERLLNAYYANPNCIVASKAHRITFNENGSINPYGKWEHDVDNQVGYNLLPLGGEGVVYKMNLLHADICNSELYLKLAPNADDVWFFFMSYLLGKSKVIIDNAGKSSVPIDLFYQYFNRSSALMWSNCGEGHNDSQILSVMQYYDIKIRNY